MQRETLRLLVGRVARCPLDLGGDPQRGARAAVGTAAPRRRRRASGRGGTETWPSPSSCEERPEPTPASLRSVPSSPRRAPIRACVGGTSGRARRPAGRSCDRPARADRSGPSLRPRRCREGHRPPSRPPSAAGRAGTAGCRPIVRPPSRSHAEAGDRRRSRPRPSVIVSVIARGGGSIRTAAATGRSMPRRPTPRRSMCRRGGSVTTTHARSGSGGDQCGEQVGGGLVEVVGVLDRDQCRPVEQQVDEICDDLVQLRRHGTPRRARRPRAWGRPRHRAAPRAAGATAAAPGPRRRPPGATADQPAGRRFPADAERLAQQLAPDRVRGAGGVRLTRGVHRSMSSARAAGFLEEPGLADARLADDLYQHASARSRAVERFVRARASARDGRRAAARAVERAPARIGSPTDHARTGRGLALDRNGSSSVVRIRVAERSSTSAVAKISPGGGRGHQPRGEVHGVAHHGVGASIPRTDIAREDATSMHADADGERTLPVGDLPQRRAACAPRRCRSPMGRRP